MSENINQPVPNIRKMLLRPFMLGMIALMAFISLALYLLYVHYHSRVMDSSHARAGLLFTSTIRAHQAALSGVLQTLSNDPEVIRNIKSGNSGALYKRNAPLFASFRDSRQWATLMFYNAERRVIMRIHRPEDKGDRLFRPQLEESSGLVSSFDITHDGNLALRAIYPVHDAPNADSDSSGTLVGYIEASVLVTSVIDSAPELRPYDFVFGLMRRALSKERLEHVWEDNPATRKYWKDVGDDNFYFSKSPLFSKDFAKSLSIQHPSDGEHAPSTVLDPSEEENARQFSLIEGQNYYIITSLALSDYSGTDHAHLFIIEKATTIWDGYIVGGLLIVAVGLGIVLLLRAFFTKQLAATDARLAQMMATIRDGEHVFENIFTESETGFVIVDWMTGAVTKANRAAMAIFGVVDTQDIQLNSITPLEADDPLQEDWKKLGSSTALMSVKNDRGIVYCEVSQFYIGAHGEWQCVAIRDVTETLSLQTHTRRHVEYLQNVVDSLPSNLCIKDSSLRVVLYNSAFEQFFGTGHATIGAVRYNTEHPEFMDKIIEADNKALQSDTPVVYEGDFPGDNGTMYTHVVAKQRIIGPDGNFYVLTVATDITERKDVERQLEQMRRKAEEANQAKSQFLASMSHEIRTPMNVILGMSHLALNAQPDARQQGYLSKIHGAAKNLLGLINDILDFSKIEAGEMRLEHIPFALNEVMDDVKVHMQTLLIEKESVRFVLDAPAFPNEFLGDPLRVRQVLLNLCNNAIKFTHEGAVTLHCTVEVDTEGAATLHFAVEDTGIGIPEEGLKRLFTSFQQVDGSTTRKYGGTGLGLAISQQLVRAMGGLISVQSVVGKGSTFSFTLTLDKAALPEPPEHDLPGVAAAWSEFAESRKSSEESGNESTAFPLPEAAVLVVEDNEINQEIIVELLHAYGTLRVDAVSNGKEAVDAVQQKTYDLVLMDLQMPVMGGLEATEAIRALAGPSGRVPIIALTANAMTEDRERCLSVGMDDFLSKPIDVADLQAKLEQWLGGEGRKPM